MTVAHLARNASFVDRKFPRGAPVHLSPETAPHPLPFGVQMCRDLGFRMVRIGDDQRDRYAHPRDLVIPPEEEAEWLLPRNHPLPEAPV